MSVHYITFRTSKSKCPRIIKNKNTRTLQYMATEHILRMSGIFESMK